MLQIHVMPPVHKLCAVSQTVSTSTFAFSYEMLTGFHRFLSICNEAVNFKVPPHPKQVATLPEILKS